MADDLAGYLAGLVLECEDVRGKDKLKELKVDVGGDEPLTLVTNASNVEVGKRVVVATIGSELKDGAKVKKAMVGGVTSEGMLCDGPMLGWTGGGAGAAALLPESFKPGEAPPKSRPRLDGGGAGGDAPAAPVAKSTGPGVDSLFEKKLTKEEKKALAKKKREEKKKAKGKTGKAKSKKEDEGADEKKDEDGDNVADALNALDIKGDIDAKREEALEQLSKDNIVVTYEAKKGALHANSRDINVGGVTVAFHGKNLIEETNLVINYGNRYGFIGPNGSGKSTIMKAIAARAIPIPDGLDIYFLDSEYPARDDITALEAVLESSDEIAKLEKQADALNNAMADADEDRQLEIQAQLEGVYDRLDQLDAATAETRATSILHGLGFTLAMQGMKTCEFSGGWRMRVALARALFLQPEFLLLDEPTNHLGTFIVLF